MTDDNLTIAIGIEATRDSEGREAMREYLLRFGNGSGDDAKAFRAGWDHAIAFCCRMSGGPCFCGCHETAGVASDIEAEQNFQAESDHHLLRRKGR